MGPRSLLVCADAPSVQVLSRILLNLGLEVDYCSEPSDALAHFSGQHFDTVLIDCEKEAAAIALISELRMRNSQKDVVVIAMLDRKNNAREVFAGGANFILYKPVSDERLAQSVAAAKTLIRGERRLTQRVPVDANASIAYAATENVATRVMDLSVDGIAIYSVKPIPRNCKVYFQFSLPDETSTIRLSCEVIWQNDSGNVGLRFVDVPKASRKVLDYWIKNKVGRKLQIVESPGQPAEPVAELTVRTSKDLREQLTAHLGLIAGSPPERRRQPRHQCSLGAMVSRAGSLVQQRCTVTDLSLGGCYVQTSEPLPAGSAIEIVMRTHDVKAKVPGKVQSVHRGLGMGVHFAVDKLPVELERLISEVQKQPMSV